MIRRRITLNFNTVETTEKVNLIKNVRIVTGLGLKEAKDMVERIHKGGYNIAVVSYGVYEFETPFDHHEALTQLERFGVGVNVIDLDLAKDAVAPSQVIASSVGDHLAEAAIIAIRNRHFAQAISILQLIE